LPSLTGSSPTITPTIAGDHGYNVNCWNNLGQDITGTSSVSAVTVPVNSGVTLFAKLTATPSSVNANEKTDLTATVTGGTATGTPTYLNQNCGSNSNGDTGNITAKTTNGTFKCDYPAPGTYTATADVTRQGITVPTSTLITVTAPVAGTCGTANNHFFEVNESNWGAYTQCASGTPSATTFPNKGTSVNWTCDGTPCTAKRKLGCYITFKGAGGLNIDSATVGQTDVNIYASGAFNVGLKTPAKYTCTGPLSMNDYSLPLSKNNFQGIAYWYSGNVNFGKINSVNPNTETCTVTLESVGGVIEECSDTITISAATTPVTCGVDDNGSFPNTPTNLCSSGSATGLTGGASIGSTWNWTCGSASCSATKTCGVALTYSCVGNTMPTCDPDNDCGAKTSNPVCLEKCGSDLTGNNAALNACGPTCTLASITCPCKATPMKWTEQ
jgi:hypothetical protein